VQLHRPAGVQLENIAPGHQHIDLIYFANPVGPTDIEGSFNKEEVDWYGPEDWDQMSLNLQVRGWCERALAVLPMREAGDRDLGAFRGPSSHGGSRSWGR
jgi:hypothetical protein